MTIEKILLEFDPTMDNLLAVLKKTSDEFGFVGEEHCEIIANYFSVPESRVYETASFYDLISVREKPKVIIQICSSANCALKDSFRLVTEIENLLKIKSGDDFNPKIKLEEISCLGRCAEGPVMVVNGKVFEKVTKSSLHTILEKYI